ncbi:MAG: hypothetical protein ACW97P_12165 [Candidatus Hodarchaeales archaeon]|jgi:hypothetical protein
MAFEQEVNLTKDAIGDFEIRFFVPVSISPETPQTGELNAQIIMSDNSILPKSFDLLERLQDDAAGLIHLSNLADLRDYVRTRLENEVLP